MSETITRRDAMKIIGATVGATAGAMAVSSCESDTKARVFTEMLSTGETTPQILSYIETVPPDMVEDNDAHNRTAQLKRSNEFMLSTGDDSYKPLGPWGLMTLPGDTNVESTWANLSVGELNGSELFFIWESENDVLPMGSLHSYDDLKPLPALEDALKNNVEVFPDIRYALMDKVQDGPDKIKFVFNPNKARYLLDHYPNIVGFTIDEPYKLGPHSVYGVEIDWEEFLTDYSSSGLDLPIHITNFGIRYAEGNLTKPTSEDEDPIRYVNSTLYALADRLGIRIIGGNFYYDLTEPIDFGRTTDQIIEEMRQAYLIEFADSESDRAPDSSWYALPAHDVPNSQGHVYYQDYIDRARAFELPGDYENEATKLYLQQVISALANNPTYTRFLFWNYPYSGGEVPYQKAQSAINELRDKLKNASKYFAGELKDHYNFAGHYSYTVKEITAFTSDGKLQRPNAIFVDTINGEFPSHFLLGINAGKYIDEVTGLVIEINGFGKVVEIPTDIPPNTVFAFVPAK